MPDAPPDVGASVSRRWSTWYGPAVAAAAAVASLAVYRRLPAEVVTHWGGDGAPNGWSPRPVGAFGTPAMMLGIWTLLRAAPAVDPRRANYAKFGGARDALANAAVTLLLVVHGAVLTAALGRPVPVVRLGSVALGLFLAAVGNVLPRVRANFFIGVRTPWTLSSDAAWARTHRLAGHLVAGAGVAITLGALWLPPAAVGALIAGAAVTAVVVPTAYSYVVWSRESRGPRGGARR